MGTDVRIATSDDEIATCFAAMRELRPHLTHESFVSRVRRQEADAYRLVFREIGGKVVAVAGFRISESLAWGKYLYVDDLVTAAGERSKGHGGRLLRWLIEYARSHDCDQLHLDSGVQRTDAHRFYRREGLEHASHHFSLHLDRTGD